MGRQRRLKQGYKKFDQAIAQLTDQAKAECLLTGDAHMQAVLGAVDQLGPIVTQELLMLEMIERVLGGRNV